MKKILHWAIRIVPAAIMLQTLFFKFGGSEESIYIFSTLGMEPWGRYGSGMIELIASLLLLSRKYSGIGGLLGLETMSGAIVSHLAFLGVEVKGDGGYLFFLAIVTFVTCFIVLIQERHNLLALIRKFSTKK